MATRKSAASQESAGNTTSPTPDVVAEDDNSFIFDGQPYVMATQDDLSLADQENLSRFFIQLQASQTWPADDDGLLPVEHETALHNLEVRVCCIALPEATAEVFIGKANKRRRTQVINRFTRAVDMTPFLDRLLAQVRPQMLAAMQTLREMNALTQPSLVPGRTIDASASATPEPSPPLSSAAEAA